MCDTNCMAEAQQLKLSAQIAVALALHNIPAQHKILVISAISVHSGVLHIGYTIFLYYDTHQVISKTIYCR